MLYSQPSRLAAYNTWANARLYDAATALTDFERKRDVKAYFKSLHGTLNHILQIDRLWIDRFEGVTPADEQASNQHEQFAELREAREAEDKRLMSYLATLEASDLANPFDYQDNRNEPKSLPLGTALTHLFNHQTHYRGQATHILRQLGVAEPPSLDLLSFALPSS